MSFERAIAFVLEHEGGLVDNPKDPGGVTKFGISKRAYPHLDIRNLSVMEAMDIYQQDYWRPIKGDKLPMGVDIVMLDYAVHSGVRHAVQALQRAVGAKADGVIGPGTLSLVAARKRPRTLALDLARARMNLLVRLVKQKPSQVEFLGGWMSRLFDLVGEIYAVTM